jgi:hypothetical protein
MNAQTPRPRRQRKGDRLLNPDARRAEIETDHAVAPFDRMANEMDAKWGIDRLPTLVTPELAARYGAAVGYLNECIRENDPAKTVAAVNNCLRGMEAMNAEATKLGRKPASGRYIEYALEDEHGGEPFRFGILFDGAEWQTAQDQRPDLKFFTMREAAIALRTKMNTGPIAEIKKAFPGAQVVEHRRTPMEELLNDEIPPFAPETRA